MLIHDVKEATGLTKKAIEYYTQKGLVMPSVLENGYRDYSEKDVEILKKTAVLRKLDIGLEEIKWILFDHSKEIFWEAAVRKEWNIQKEQLQKEILGQLAQSKSYEEIDSQIIKLEVLEKRQTITEKLLEAFPGYYGRYICLHFAAFLNEPIETEKQQKAYETILEFLDNMEILEFPKDLQEYLMENTSDIGVEQITEIISSNQKAVENPDAFLKENKEIIEWYLEYKKSEEYQNSPASKIMEFMKEFNQASGYYDVFIPALKELSHSYAEYCLKMEMANEKILEWYPEIREQ